MSSQRASFPTSLPPTHLPPPIWTWGGLEPTAPQVERGAREKLPEQEGAELTSDYSLEQGTWGGLTPAGPGQTDMAVETPGPPPSPGFVLQEQHAPYTPHCQGGSQAASPATVPVPPTCYEREARTLNEFF